MEIDPPMLTRLRSAPLHPGVRACLTEPPTSRPPRLPGRAGRLPYATASGKATTSASVSFPSSHMTSRSNPSATPLHAGSPASSAASKRLSAGQRGEAVTFAAAVFPADAAAEFGGVGQFAVAVGQFDAVRVQLEPLRDRRIARPDLRQRRLRGRVVAQEARPAGPRRRAQVRFDQFRQQQVQQSVAVAPRPGRDRHAAVGGQRAELGRGHRQHRRAGEPGEGVVVGQHGESVRRQRRAVRGRRGLPRGPHQPFGARGLFPPAVPHAVPLGHGELRVVPGTRLPVAEHAAHLPDGPGRGPAERGVGGEQPLHVELGGGLQVPPPPARRFGRRVGVHGGDQRLQVRVDHHVRREGGRLDFQIPLRPEEPPHRVQQVGPAAERVRVGRGGERVGHGGVARS